jgi:hypothetical protein
MLWCKTVTRVPPVVVWHINLTTPALQFGKEFGLRALDGFLEPLAIDLPTFDRGIHAYPFLSDVRKF